MYAVVYNEDSQRYRVVLLKVAKKHDLDIISTHITYKQAERAAAELN